MYRITLLTTLALTLALSGCGGGGSGSGSSPAVADPTGSSAEDSQQQSGGQESENGNEDSNDAPSPPPASPYTLFESGQVRPLAWSPAGDRLFVANTPANRLDIFSFDGARLELALTLLLDRESYAYSALWESFTQNQRRLLLQLCAEEASSVYAAGFLQASGLRSASSAQRAVEGLVARDVLDADGGQLRVSDRFFRLWVLRNLHGQGRP